LTFYLDQAGALISGQMLHSLLLSQWQLPL